MSARPKKSEQAHLETTRANLVAAALAHVPFDGWSAASFQAAIAQSGTPDALARLACPRGATDLAIAHHRRGDQAMAAAARTADLAGLRYGQKVAALVDLLIRMAGDKEAVRRGLTFFAMPAHAVEGAAAIWATADLIWETLGDTSTDFNWYSKRVILSAVYSSTVLFWLGDESPGHRDTRAFLDRRIENVLQFEKAKGKLRDTKLLQGFMRGPGRWLDRLQKPEQSHRADLPGYSGAKNR